MKHLVYLFSVMLLTVTPVWAGEPEAFDPDQLFKQALSHQLLESLVGHALAALGDHVEISGSLDSDPAEGDRRQTLRFKFYPEGKSKSDEHIAAEGWFGSSEDLRQQELHFRFAVPRSSTGSYEDRFDNVL